MSPLTKCERCGAYYPLWLECPCVEKTITSLRSRVEKLEQALHKEEELTDLMDENIGRWVGRYIKLESKIADLERENAELIAANKCPTRCLNTVWQTAQRAAYERAIEIVGDVVPDIKWGYDGDCDVANEIEKAIRAEMEKGGAE